jgi:hypothetical protein
MSPPEQHELEYAANRGRPRFSGFHMPRLSPLSRLGVWLAGSLCLFTFGFMTDVSSATLFMSEACYLQTVTRVLAGETLYRDVWFGTSPLPVYLTVALASVFGAEALLVKAIMAACLTLTTLLSYRVARQLGMGRVLALALAGAIAIYTTSWLPGPGLPYTPLAYICLTAAFSAILSWRESALRQTLERSRGLARHLMIAGVSAGLSFSCKQNIGIYALVGLWIALIACQRETGLDRARLLKSLLLLSSAFAVVVGLVLLPVLLSGGLPRFIDYTFASKSEYLRFGQIPYRAQLDELMRMARDRASRQDPSALYYQLAFLLPFPAIAALLWVWFRGGAAKRGPATIVLGFAASAFAGVFPRVDLSHMIASVPALLLSLAWACRQLLPRASRRWALVVGLALLLGLGTGARSTYLLNPLRRIRSGAMQVSDLPHFRGCLMWTDFIESVRANAKELTESTAGESVFILDNSGPVYYLVTGIKNPTPYDDPQAHAFGVNGQAEVIAAIEQGRISYVCMNPLGADILAPVRLEDYVQTRMERVRDLGFCTLYRSRF